MHTNRHGALFLELLIHKLSGRENSYRNTAHCAGFAHLASSEFFLFFLKVGCIFSFIFLVCTFTFAGILTESAN